MMNLHLSFIDELKNTPVIKPKPKDIEDKGILAKGGLDTVFLILVCLLLTIGLIMMFSASYVTAKYSKMTGGNPFFYIIRQGIFAAGGLAAMLILSKINYNVYRKFAPVIFIISFLLLIYVLINPAELEGKEQFKRWIAIPGTAFRLQPSEIAKFGLIIFLAWSFERHRLWIEKSRVMSIAYFGIIAVFALLVYMEDHLSGAILMLAIGVVITFLGGLDWRIYAAGTVLVVIAVIILITAPDKVLKGYMAERINFWLDKDYTNTNERWQVNQSLFALGSGGFFGLGLGNSKQKYLYLPEPQNDFIFAIVGEELGFVGCVFIIILFALLVWRGFAIAMKSRSTFGRLMSMGIVIQVGLQVILNIMVVTDSMPNTGISLPFFSYGGTSLLMLLGEMGIVLSVSRSSRINKVNNKTVTNTPKE